MILLGWLLAGCTAAPAVQGARTYALPADPTVTELATRAGLVRLLVYAPADPRRGPRREIVAGGSGTLLGTSGIVATAAHVATDPHYRVLVRRPDGTTHEGFTVRFDPDRDLALVCVPGLRGVRGAVPAPGPPAEAGPVLGFGFPDRARVSVAAGRIRRADAGDSVRYGSFGIDRPIELELEIAPGYSGGPVIDTQGRLVGILAGFAMDFEGGTPRTLGIAYAVPANLLAGAPFVDALDACLANRAA